MYYITEIKYLCSNNNSKSGKKMECTTTFYRGMDNFLKMMCFF